MSSKVLGLWNMGEGKMHNLLSPIEVKRIIKKAYKEGITSFDTAYSYGNSDSLLSSALKELRVERESYKIIDKVMPIPTLMEKVETELRRLNSDFLDILLLHWPTKEKELFKALKTLENLLNEGKALSIGVSNFPLSLIKKVIKDFPLSYSERALSLLWTKDYEEEKKLIKVISYSPLAMGTLSGKWSTNMPPLDERKNLYFFSSPLFDNLITTLKKIANKYNSNPSAVALAWVNRESPEMIIRGFSNEKQLEEKEIEISDEEFISLSNLSKEITSLTSSDNIFSHKWDNA